MRVRIYQPARNAMQSGNARTKKWVMEFPPQGRDIDPLMGWTSSSDTQTQVRMTFESKEAALAYALKHGIEVVVVPAHERKLNIRAGGYGENFSPSRREPWTH